MPLGGLKGLFLGCWVLGSGKPLYHAKESSLVPLRLHPVQFLQKGRFMKPLLLSSIKNCNLLNLKYIVYFYTINPPHNFISKNLHINCL